MLDLISVFLGLDKVWCTENWKGILSTPTIPQNPSVWAQGTNHSCVLRIIPVLPMNILHAKKSRLDVLSLCLLWISLTPTAFLHLQTHIFAHFWRNNMTLLCDKNYTRCKGYQSWIQTNKSHKSPYRYQYACCKSLSNWYPPVQKPARTKTLPPAIALYKYQIPSAWLFFLWLL